VISFTELLNLQNCLLMTDDFRSAVHRAMSRDTKVVAAWDFDRIIPCHGDVVDTGGKQIWLDAFKMYL